MDKEELYENIDNLTKIILLKENLHYSTIEELIEESIIIGRLEVEIELTRKACHNSSSPEYALLQTRFNTIKNAYIKEAKRRDQLI